MKLCELIESRRKQSGMSLQDLADACGATKTHVWEIEQGKTVNIGLLLAVRLSIALGIPVNALAAATMES
jgi:transcriptional regulator with XRE-family HTH domain